MLAACRLTLLAFVSSCGYQAMSAVLGAGIRDRRIDGGGRPPHAVRPSPGMAVREIRRTVPAGGAGGWPKCALRKSAQPASTDPKVKTARILWREVTWHSLAGCMVVTGVNGQNLRCIPSTS